MNTLVDIHLRKVTCAKNRGSKTPHEHSIYTKMEKVSTAKSTNACIHPQYCNKFHEKLIKLHLYLGITCHPLMLKLHVSKQQITWLFIFYKASWDLLLQEALISFSSTKGS